MFWIIGLLFIYLLLFCFVFKERRRKIWLLKRAIRDWTWRKCPIFPVQDCFHWVRSCQFSSWYSLWHTGYLIIIIVTIVYLSFIRKNTCSIYVIFFTLFILFCILFCFFLFYVNYIVCIIRKMQWKGKEPFRERKTTRKDPAFTVTSNLSNWSQAMGCAGSLR